MIRVFPRQTKWTPNDELAFVGPPPLTMRPDPALEVWISITFSWDRKRAEELAVLWRRITHRVRVGGPAYGAIGGPFTPGLFIKQGVTFTSRGCPKCCPWCLVPDREGPLREIPIQPGSIVQDNNLLACSQGHCEAVYEMLSGQTAVQLKGGLHIDYLTPWHVDRLKALPSLDELWVACDTDAALPKLDKAADLLGDFSIEKRRCYVLIGFGDDTPAKAEARCEAVYAKGFLPFVQYYKPPDAERWITDMAWLPVLKKWLRPGYYRAKPKPEPETLWKAT